jgi:hypothetical protein
MRGETTSDGETVAAGNRFFQDDVGPARAAVRKWRAALLPRHRTVSDRPG